MASASSTILSIAFNKAVELQPSEASVAVHCEGQAQGINVPPGHLSMNDGSLLISMDNVFQSAMQETQSCDLIVGEGTVRDEDGVAFLGVQSGDYSVLFSDSVPPQVLAYQPSNGEDDVHPSSVFTLTFNERVLLARSTSGLRGSLAVLEGGADSRAPVASTQFDVSPEVLTIEDSRLQVNVVGITEPGQHYSLSLPPGAVTDLSGNAFPGLPVGTYTFRTGHFAQAPEEVSSGSGMTLSGAVAVLGTVSLAFLIVAGVVWRTRRLFNLQHLDEGKRSTVRPQVEPRPSQSPPFVPEERWRSQSWTEASAQGTAWAQRQGDPQTPQRQSSSAPSGNVGWNVHATAQATAAAQAAEAQKRWQAAFGAKRAADAFSAAARPRGSAGAPHPISHPGTPQPTSHPGSQRSPQRGTASEVPSRPASKSEAPPPRPRARSEGVDQAPRNSRHGAGGAAAGRPPQAPGPSAAKDKPGRSSSREPPPSASGAAEDPELQRQKRQVERRMRELFDAPILERKRALRELMLEFHPDKNSDAHAKDVFQYINASRDWFLCET